MKKKAIGLTAALILGIAGIVTAQGTKGGYLGVSTAPVDEALARHLDIGESVGVQVTYVDKDGPSHGTIKPHDVIHKIDGQIIVNHDQLATLIRNVHKAGDEVDADIIRRGKPIKVKVTLGEAPDFPEPRSQAWGMPGGSHQPFPLQPYNWQQRTPRAFQRRPRIAPQGGWEDLQEQMNDLMNRKQDVGKQFEDVQKRMEEIMKQFQQQQRQFAPGGDDEDVQVHTHTEFSTSVSTSDGDLSMTLKADKSGKHLRAERAGKVIHDGPVNTDEERAKLPEDVREKLEKMEAGVNVKIHTMGSENDENEDVDVKVFQIDPKKQKIEIQLKDEDSI